MKKYIFTLFTIILTGCYSETIDSFSTFTFQFPVNFEATYILRAVPRTSRDFANLYKYKEYNDNKDKISKAKVFQLNFWVDSLVMPDGTPYNPLKHDVVFDYVRYVLKFAKPKYGNPFSTDSADFMIDPEVEEFVLGTYDSVNIADFYRNPNHIIQIPDDVATTISEFLKNKPYFYIETQYSKVRGQTQDEIYFPYLKARFDVDIRFEVNL